MKRYVYIIGIFFISNLFNEIISSKTTYWTSISYPDIRGKSYKKCAQQLPEKSLLYICDPDHIINVTELSQINAGLEKLAVGTPCPCQRRSQCSSGDDKGSPFHGFVVSIAILDNIEMNIHSPSEEQLTNKAESFSKTLSGRWALGDCGNSVIVFVWKHYKKVIIWPARLAEKYITVNERKALLSKVNHFIQNDQWAEALKQITKELHIELTGEPEDRVDTGTLSLLIAVGVALALTILITCCVCAFRCCGNLPMDEDAKSLSRIESFRAQVKGVMQRGSYLRRSFSKSPKFTRPSSGNVSMELVNENGSSNQVSV